eukprot:c19421_g1_i1 orf=15-284(-)
MLCLPPSPIQLESCCTLLVEYFVTSFQSREALPVRDLGAIYVHGHARTNALGHCLGFTLYHLPSVGGITWKVNEEPFQHFPNTNNNHQQ